MKLNYASIGGLVVAFSLLTAAIGHGLQAGLTTATSAEIAGAIVAIINALLPSAVPQPNEKLG